MAQQDIRWQQRFANFKKAHGPGSDIDLTIVGHLDWQIFNQIAIELDDLLLPYQIDVSLHEQLDNEDLMAHIGRVGQIFYSR